MSNVNFDYIRLFDGWVFNDTYTFDVDDLIDRYMHVCNMIHGARVRLVFLLQNYHSSHKSEKKHIRHRLRLLTNERRAIVDELITYRVDYLPDSNGYSFVRILQRRRHYRDLDDYPTEDLGRHYYE